MTKNAPTWIDTVARTIGPEAYREVLRVLAGKRINLPRTIGPDHYMANIIGQPLAQKLADEVNGVDIEIPMGSRRRQMIIDDLKAGYNVRQVMRRYGRSRRMVQMTKADAVKAGDLPPDDDDQMSLL